jgi:hypothetical protein
VVASDEQRVTDDVSDLGGEPLIQIQSSQSLRARLAFPHQVHLSEFTDFLVELQDLLVAAALDPKLCRVLAGHTLHLRRQLTEIHASQRSRHRPHRHQGARHLRRGRADDLAPHGGSEPSSHVRAITGTNRVQPFGGGSAGSNPAGGTTRATSHLTSKNKASDQEKSGQGLV